MQRRPGAGRVVLGAGRQTNMLGSERQQALEGCAPAGERRAARLVGERDRHRRPNHDAERLDRVELQPREVVEAVQQHRCGAPQRGGATQRVERAGHLPLGADTGSSQPLKTVTVPLEQLPQLACVGGVPWVRCRPGVERTTQARGRDPLHLQLPHQRREGTHHARRGGRLRGRALAGAGTPTGTGRLFARIAQYRCERPFASQPAERALGGASATEGLGEQALKAHHADLRPLGGPRASPCDRPHARPRDSPGDGPHARPGDGPHARPCDSPHARPRGDPCDSPGDGPLGDDLGLVQLQPIALHVGVGGYDQQRPLPARVVGTQRIHHHPGLPRIGGPRDQRDRHGRP